MIKEKWKPIEGFEGRYEISNNGQVKSIERYVNHYCGGVKKVPEKILSHWKNHMGYRLVSLHKDNLKIGISVHILVARAFVKNPHNKPEVNHKDGNKDNNHYKNLEWNTRLENQQHSVYTLGKHFAGEAHYKAKIKVDTVLKMRELHKTGKYNMAEIGRMFGVNNKDHAANIIKGKCWKTLKRV